MSAEPDLLPLPEMVEVDKHLPTGVRIYAYDANTLKDYARANVAHAIAAKDAEIEVLRAEVAWQKRVKSAHAELHREAKEHAERLAEALREARQTIRDLLPDATFTKWDALLRDHDQEARNG